LSLRDRIVSVLLLVSLLPLVLVGFGAWSTFSRMLDRKTMELHEVMVQNHASTIELYLAERVRVLDLAARSHSVERLGSQEGLEELYRAFREGYGDTFVDLGVIDASGRHLAYIGPYDLMERNYADAEWFRTVLSEGSYISDVFLGYRQVPHCIVAVHREEDGRDWILRATINSERFEELVGATQLGRTGEAFIVDRQGRLQTPTRHAQVLDPAPIAMSGPHAGVQHSRVEDGEHTSIQATTWINGGRWLLVVQQDEAEIREPVRQAGAWAASIIALAVVLVGVTTFFSTRHLTNQIDQANAERESLSRELLRSGKLASLGEMATGLAHEINNPLAIISAEQTNVSDLILESMTDSAARTEILEAVATTRRQVKRCGEITAKMLQFGRKTESHPQALDIAPLVEEMVQLMSRQASVRNVDLSFRRDGALPRVRVDSTELQQVVVNLVNNAIYATNGGGRVEVRARGDGDHLEIAVTDTGCGISKENLERVFLPFFTTKPVGHGTGLGLSVCYGIVRSWGGTIDVASTEGAGTEFRIRIPAIAPVQQERSPSEVSP